MLLRIFWTGLLSHLEYKEVGIKRYKVMMVAVLGIVVLLLSFAPMPAATTVGQETDEPRWG
jgi:hypothetical protein